MWNVYIQMNEATITDSNGVRGVTIVLSNARGLRISQQVVRAERDIQ